MLLSAKKFSNSPSGILSYFRKEQNIRKKPWGLKSSLVVPRAIYKLRGMLGCEERRALYWIGRNYYSGAGAIVDAGAYVGASAFCLAAGVARSGHGPSAGPIVYSYDYFKALDTYVAEDITRHFRPAAVGSEYLDIYHAQTKPFAALVKPIPGNFLEAKWAKGPIEVLFVDVAKTRDLNSHVIREFFPHLVPGRSLLIHQDFYHAWHPYIHATMEILKDYFEVIDRHIQLGTRLYLYKTKIPDQILRDVADYLFTPAQQLAYIDAFVAGETGDMRAMAEVVRLCQLTGDGDIDAAKRSYASFQKTYGRPAPATLWWNQAQQVMAPHVTEADQA